MSIKEKGRYVEGRKTNEDEEGRRKDEKRRTGIQRFGAELCLPHRVQNISGEP